MATSTATRMISAIMKFNEPWLQTLVIALFPLIILVRAMSPFWRRLVHDLNGRQFRRGLKNALLPLLCFLVFGSLIVAGTELLFCFRYIFHGIEINNELQLDYQWPRKDVYLKWNDIKSVNIERTQLKLRYGSRLRIEAEKDAYFSVWTSEVSVLLDAHRAIEKRLKTRLLK